MAYLTVNTQGTHPHVYVSMDTTNLFDGTSSATWVTTYDALDVTCLQDVTVNNSTGIFSWTDFCSEDMNKITEFHDCFLGGGSFPIYLSLKIIFSIMPFLSEK